MLKRYTHQTKQSPIIAISGSEQQSVLHASYHLSPDVIKSVNEQIKSLLSQGILEK